MERDAAEEAAWLERVNRAMREYDAKRAAPGLGGEPPAREMLLFFLGDGPGPIGRTAAMLLDTRKKSVERGAVLRPGELASARNRSTLMRQFAELFGTEQGYGRDRVVGWMERMGHDQDRMLLHVYRTRIAPMRRRPPGRVGGRALVCAHVVG